VNQSPSEKIGTWGGGFYKSLGRVDSPKLISVPLVLKGDIGTHRDNPASADDKELAVARRLKKLLQAGSF
jgi:hypothetical protein